MKSCPGRGTLLHAALLIGLAGCAASPPSTVDDDRAAQFEAGTAALSCGATCADAWRQDAPQRSALYQTGQWRALALDVLRTNFRQDLGYFYLGRAAEGLGLRPAALDYYRSAVSLATGPDAGAKCGEATEGCDGVNLLSEALLRTQIVNAARVPHARHARQSSSDWVDPAPVQP